MDDVATGAPAKMMFGIDDSEITAIQSISKDGSIVTVPVGGVYTLSGVKVADSYNENLSKGIYVINGKKVVVK